MASSRFFATGDSSDESEHSQSGSDEEVDVSTQLGGAGQVKLVYSSSESEEEKRTIRTAKDKAFDHILQTTKAMRNHIKIQDYTSVTKDWEALGKQIEKAKAVIAKEGMPGFYYQSIAALNQNLNETFANKDEVKKMSKSNSQALNALRSKVKKQVTAQPLAKELDAYLKKNPLPANLLAGDDAEDEDDKKPKKKKAAESEDEDDEAEAPKPKAATAKKPVAKKKKDESSSSESSSDSSSGSSDEESDEDESSDSDSSDSDSSISSDDSDADVETGGNAFFTREFWLKKEYKKGYKGPKPKPVGGDDEDVTGDEDGSGGDDEDEDGKDEQEKEELAAERRKRHEERAALKQSKKEQFAKLKEALTAADAEEEKKAQEEELKPEQVLKRLKDLLALRGKRGTDAAMLIAELKNLRTKSLKVATPPALLKLNVTLMASLFDLQLNKSVKNKSGKDADPTRAAAAAAAAGGAVIEKTSNQTEEFMNIKDWKEACEVLSVLLVQLRDTPTIKLSEDEKQDETFLDEDLSKRTSLLTAGAEEDAAPSGEAGDEKEQKESQQTVLSPTAKAQEEKRLAAIAEQEARLNDPNHVHYVVGSLLGFIQSLCREYTKSLLHIDPHSLEYIERLKHESMLVDLVGRVQEYYSRMSGAGKKQMEAKVVLLRLELLFYRYHPELDVLKKQVEAAAGAAPQTSAAAQARAADVQNTVPQLAQFLYKHGDQKARTRGLLMHVFFLALHSRYTEARELLLMSHLHESVHDLGMKTRILYNRALAQLGICAFKLGEFRQSVDALAELHQSGKIKELLAQGVSMNRWQERDMEEEEQHRRRQYPYHQHLNLDSLEAVNLIGGMLLEVPNLALHGNANKRRILSRLFRRMWEHHQRQAFNGPPENTRDLIMAGTKALTKGDWEGCASAIKKLRLWDSMKAASGQALVNHVQHILVERIKEEALRTYLISYSQHYAHINHDHLSKMFDLPSQTVQKIASSLMVNEQLHAVWDEPANLLVIEQKLSNKLQKAALAFTDKALVFLDQNERLLDSRPQDRERRERQDASVAKEGGDQGGNRLAGRFRGGGRGGRGRGRGGRGGGGRGGGRGGKQ